MINAGKEQSAMELKLSIGEVVPTVSVNAYIGGNITPSCPGGGVYTYNVVGTNPTCSIVYPTSHRLVTD